ncbi:MAG: beta strand repeat-containing protein [Acidimicrobiales bacterium]
MRGRRAGLAIAAVLTLAVPAMVFDVQGASAVGHPSCSDSWKARAGGQWSTGADWSRGSPPTSGEGACITVPLSGPVVLTGPGSAASLLLGGSTGPDELMLDGGTLSLASTSTVARTGELASQGYSSSVQVGTDAVLANHGKVEVNGSLELSGAVTNAPDGSVSVGSASLYFGTGRFTNLGEVLTHPNQGIVAPFSGTTGAVIDNAGGTILDLGSVAVNKGATFIEGSGTLAGVAPTISGALDLAGAGASQFDLTGYLISPSLSGNVAPDQTLLVHGGPGDPVEATGSFTNDGTIFGLGCLKLPAGGTLTNAGMIVVAPGVTFCVAANVKNQVPGTIAMDGNSPYGAGLDLQGAVTLTNDGTIDVGSLNSSLNAGSAGTIFNQAGTISNGGTVSVPVGATFVEGAGTTSGGPVLVAGALHLVGNGPSSFDLLGSDFKGATLSGDIARSQTLWVDGTSLSPTHSLNSFTNFGTFIGNGYFKLPSGDTLTNEGTLEVGHGGLGSDGLDLEGDLVNAPSGVIGEEGAGLNMDTIGTSFLNEGTAYMLLYDNYVLAAGDPQSAIDRDVTFRNTGTIYLGVGGDVAWGGFGLASSFLAYNGDTVEIGGKVIPVPASEPAPGLTPGGARITYGLTGLGTDIPGTRTPTWALSCSARVTEGWSLTCGTNATLTEPKATTLVPTKVSVTGSGAPNGNSGWETSYGQPVTFTATVSAQDGSTPTGRVAFFGSIGLPAGSNPAIHPDLLGTATLSTKGGVTTASLTISRLPPGLYQLLALYYGDASHLAASTTYGAPGGQTYGDQEVAPQKTTVTLSSSSDSARVGAPVTLTANVMPAGLGPLDPGGVVTFFVGSTPIGTAAVTTRDRIISAQVTTANLPVGSDSITAGYSGDYNYAGATSAALAESETTT